MGSRAISAMTLGIFITSFAVYFGQDTCRIVRSLLVEVGYSDNPYMKQLLDFLEEHGTPESGSTSTKPSEISQILLTPDELKEYDGSPTSKGLYLAILGEVFDVEKGAQHYRPGGGYAFFSGRDATRAYITGDFSEAGLSDDVSDLDPASLAGLEDWLSFYKEEYKHIGHVIGKYYDSFGKPTQALLKIKEKMNEALQNKWTEDKNKDFFPPCNSEWSKERGSKVWCTKKSGGVERKWVGVPRELHIKGKDPRCVCVKNTGPPSSEPDLKEHNNRGDLDYPGLKEYAGCPANSDSCSVSHP